MSLFYILLGLAVIVGLFFLLREVFCWYYKINERVGLLREIRDELKRSNRTTTGNTNPQTTSKNSEYVPFRKSSDLDDDRWECPKCGEKNSRNSNSCSGCSYTK